MHLLAAILHAVALALIAVLALWILGSPLLRWGGALTVALGLVTALGHPDGLLIAVPGAMAWAAGHWLHALRHHTYKSPLARRLFLQLLPARLDPTRRWAIPTTTTNPRRMSHPHINPKHTTEEGLTRARAAFHGNWDRRGVTVVYLPTAVVEQALAHRGWRRGRPSRRGPGPWTSPTGYREWDTDYAFALAIAAETPADTDGRPADDEYVLRGVIDAVLERDPHPGPLPEVLTERIVAGHHPP